jgi:hypothetical protein
MEPEETPSPDQAPAERIPAPHSAKESPKKELRKQANTLLGIVGRYRTADFDKPGPWGVNDMMQVLEVMNGTAAELHGAYSQKKIAERQKATEFSRKLSAFYEQQQKRVELNRVPSPDELDTMQSFGEQARKLTAAFNLDSSAGKAMMSMVLVLPALALISAGFYSTPGGMVTDSASFNPSYFTGFASGLIVCAVLLVISRLTSGKKL